MTTLPPVSPEIFLEFRQIQKSYGNIEALRDISFQIRKGEVFALIGPNGAGKTTTIKILVGLIQNYTGDVLLSGTNLSKGRNDIYPILGYLPQEVGFQEWRTVSQALYTFGRLSGIPASEIPTRSKEILELVGLTDMGARKIAHLSGGMRQKLRLAQALMHRPRLLVLDEPMSGLDPTSRYQMKQIIKSLVAQGITVFLFVRPRSKTRDGKAMPFVFCGQVEFEGWNGDKPITVMWRLRESVPARLHSELGVP